MISAIFSSSFCFIFCLWIFPLSLLVLLMIDSFLLFFFCMCVCLLPSCTPKCLLSSFSLSAFFFLYFPFKTYYIFFFLVASHPFTFFLNFALLFPQFLLPLQINPIQYTQNILNTYCHILSIHVQYTCHLDRVL